MATVETVCEPALEFMDERPPVESLLRMDRIPHIWCPGCGIGLGVTALSAALGKADVDLDRVCIVSGIGCTGRVAGYVHLDSFHTTHGRPIPFATGLKLANDALKVIVFTGDGDLLAIGGNHFIHAARRNICMLVVCVNNFNYAMTGGQVAPTTPLDANASTAPYGNFEQPFNLPFLADSCGAVYVARWTVLHIRRLANSMAEAMNREGFAFIEVISPCPTLYSRLNRLGDGLASMRSYLENSVIQHGANTRDVDITSGRKFIVGKFVDRERPCYKELMDQHFSKILGSKYHMLSKPDTRPLRKHVGMIQDWNGEENG